MLVFSSVKIFILVFVLLIPWPSPVVQSVGATDKEIFLTPMIKRGELEKAKAASADNIKLSHIKTSMNKEVKSYSGYLTIDEKLNSNIFMWFFPSLQNLKLLGKRKSFKKTWRTHKRLANSYASTNNAETAPLILWVNGIPGYSSLDAVFLENGPFQLDSKNELKDRPSSWINSFSMLYLDAPVGSGFSFSDNETGYASTSEDEASEVYESLMQFFTLFSEYQGCDFYLAGEDYAGTFSPHIALKIEAENSKSKIKINLKGIFVGSTFIEPVKQYIWSDYFFGLGLLDEKQRDELKSQEETLKKAIAERKSPMELLQLATRMVLLPNSTFARFTGLTDTRNLITGKEPEALTYFRRFIDTKEVHEYLHVGLHKFIGLNTKAFARFAKDYFESSTKKLEQVLDKNYKVLLYAGQFDGLVPHMGIKEVLLGMKWKGAADFSKAPTTIWKMDQDVAGYVKTAGNFRYIMLRNAGNRAIIDQPDRVLDMLTRFIHDKGF